MVKQFLKSERTGFYLAVVREGEVGSGDELLPLSRDPQAVPVSEITRLYVSKHYTSEDMSLLRRAVNISALPDGWKEHFLERLDRTDA